MAPLRFDGGAGGAQNRLSSPHICAVLEPICSPSLRLFIGLCLFSAALTVFPGHKPGPTGRTTRYACAVARVTDTTGILCARLRKLRCRPCIEPGVAPESGIARFPA